MAEVMDLDVVLDSTLQFNSHVARIVDTSLRALGVVRLVMKDFKTPLLVTLHCAITRSYLQYAFVVWSGISETSCMQIERAQRKVVADERDRAPGKTRINLSHFVRENIFWEEEEL